MKRAILYARVSTHNQVDNTSLDYQIEQCKQYAIKHNFAIVKEIREQQSGARSNRPGINTAKLMGKRGLADCIIVYKMDRFMRGDDAETDPGIDAAFTERDLNRCGLEVIFLDLPPKGSKAHAYMKAINRIVASVERESIKRRFEDGKSAALANGRPAHGGRPPLGYRRNEAGFFEIVETEASAIHLIYDLYLRGKNVPFIVDYLRDNNIPGYRNSINKWGDWIVYEILKREAYYGRYAIVKTRSVEDETRANGRRPEKLPKEDWIYVNVPPIVSKEEWDRVQARRKKRTGKRKITRCKYLLSGRVTCECGYAMTGHSVKKTNKDGDIIRTRYYLCKGKSYRNALRPCNAKAIRANKLEKIVYDWVEKVISDPEFIKQLYAKTLEKRKQDEIPLRDRLDTLTVEKIEAETRLKRVARLMMDASETELSIYQPEVESLRNTIEYLASIIVGIKDEINQSEVDDNKFNDFVDYVAAVQSVISDKHDDYGFKEKAIRAIDLRVVVSLNQQSVQVECVLGSDILPLYEDQKNDEMTLPQRQMEPDSDVWIFNVSRRRCTDQML